MTNWANVKIKKSYYGTELKLRAIGMCLLVAGAFTGLGYLFYNSYQKKQNDIPTEAEAAKVLTSANYKPLEYYGFEKEYQRTAYGKGYIFVLKNTFKAVTPSGDTLNVDVVGTRSTGLSIRTQVKVVK